MSGSLVFGDEAGEISQGGDRILDKPSRTRLLSLSQVEQLLSNLFYLINVSAVINISIQFFNFKGLAKSKFHNVVVNRNFNNSKCDKKNQPWLRSELAHIPQIYSTRAECWSPIRITNYLSSSACFKASRHQCALSLSSDTLETCADK